MKGRTSRCWRIAEKLGAEGGREGGRDGWMDGWTDGRTGGEGRGASFTHWSLQWSQSSGAESGFSHRLGSLRFVHAGVKILMCRRQI